MQKRKKQSANNYVDNEVFLRELIGYRNSVASAKATNQEVPRIPEYIGECFLLIAQHLSFQPRFANYPFREDMVIDGVEKCLKALKRDKFNPDTSNNPFAYFTTVIFHEFVAKIQEEKKYLVAKYKVIMGSMDDMEEPPANPKYGDEESDQHMREFVDRFEESRKAKNAKPKPKKTVLEFEK